MGEPALTDLERDILLIVQEALPLTRTPFAEIADRLGRREEEVVAVLESLQKRGAIKRLCVVPNHYALGVVANGMSVWDVPDDLVGVVGPKLGQRNDITHCYRRPRQPDWPYNLFAMVHGTSREEVIDRIEGIARELGIEKYPHEVLFSTRLLKKQGTRVRAKAGSAADD